MTKRRILTAVLFAVCTMGGGSAAVFAADLSLPAGSRVGIIAMLTTDITHYHVGRNSSASFMRTYRVNWPTEELVEAPLAEELRSMGLEPVVLDATDSMRRQRQSWFVSSPQAARLPRQAMDDIARVLAEHNLQALIIVAPGSNVNPDNVDGNRLRRLPSYVQGWGFSTNDDADGIARPVVFNLTQMLLLGGDGRSPELAFREWGGGYVYEWNNFEPGADIKALPASELDKFRPVISDVMQRQMSRLMPHLKVAG